MIEHSVEECGAPGLRERVENRRDMGADGLALGPGSRVDPPVFDDLAVARVEALQIGVADAGHGEHLLAANVATSAPRWRKTVQSIAPRVGGGIQLGS